MALRLCFDIILIMNNPQRDYSSRSALGVELAILRMSENIARFDARSARPGWWVLAQGAPMDPEDFGNRERAREKLRMVLDAAGIKMHEYTWVWDNSSRAQVVLATCADELAAHAIARRIEQAGIPTRVTREFE